LKNFIKFVKKSIYKTMKKIVILTLIFALIGCAKAQVIIQWQKCLGGSNGEQASSIIQTTDGGYIVAGFTASVDGDVLGNHGGLDAWVVKLDKIGNLQWQKCLGGTLADYAKSIQQTTDGGYILAGWTTSNDGDVSGNNGGEDAWVVKLDTVGNIQWQKCLGGSSADEAYSIQQTTDSGYIVAGLTHSNDGDVTGNNGGNDVWVVKLDVVGNIQWQKCLGGIADERAYCIQQTTDSGYILTGWTSSNSGDVTGNHGGGDVWVVKLDVVGNIQWQKCLGGSSEEIAYSIQQTTDGGYILAGRSLSIDGDVFGNHGGYDAWVVKLDTVGNIQWQKCLGGSHFEQAYSIQQTMDGGYIVGSWTQSNNGDVFGNNGGYDMWLVKLDTIGNIQWQKCLGGGNMDYLGSVQQTNDGGYIVAGRTHSDDGDVSGNHGYFDFWVVKVIEPNISGLAFRDDNYNGVYDAGEQGVAGHLIKLEPGSLYTFTDNNGYYYFAADTGMHQVSYVSTPYWVTTGNPYYNVAINNVTDYFDTLDFPIISNLDVNDIAVCLTGSPTRVGFETQYWLTYKNWGTISTSGNVYFQYDTLLTYISSTLTPSSHNGNVIEWDYGPLGHNVQQLIQVTFQVPGIQYLGDTLFSNAWITPFALDTNITNNYDALYQEVTAGYDPNDKTVMPLGYGFEGYIFHGERLTYTIRFQNTGTDTAFTVVVRDTLDMTNLNIETFLVEAYSHPMSWDLKNNTTLEFRFENILLPDSNVNEPLSHGFVRFSISPFSNLAENTKVYNSAAIYFDFNPPIITNTTVNTYVSFIPYSISNFGPTETEFFHLYPNPFSNELNIVFNSEGNRKILLYNIIGQIVYQSSTCETNHTIDFGSLNSGIYFIEVQSKLGKSYKKVLKQ